MTISHGSLVINSLTLHKFTPSGEDVATVHLCHVRVAPTTCFKIFLRVFSPPFLSTRDLLSGLNFPFLTSSAWLMHEGAEDGLAPLPVCHGPA